MSILCILCKSRKVKKYLSFGYDYQLYRCISCGFVFADPNQVTKNKKIYEKNYQEDRLLLEKLDEEQVVEEKIRSTSNRVLTIINRYKNKHSLLDIGCGPGFFIANLKRQGWQVAGIDVSRYASEFGRNRLGVNIVDGSIDSIPPKRKFDIITMFHTLEHLADPVGGLEKAKLFLNPGGSIVILGPNFGSFDRLWHGKLWRGFSDRTHIGYFTPEHYKTALEKAGFNVEEINYDYWDPLRHLMERYYSGSWRSDHPKGFLETKFKPDIRNSISFKLMGRFGRLASKVFGLKDRDITIYANF